MALTSDQIMALNFHDYHQMILPYLNGGGVGLKLLWENSDPTQSFASGNVTLSSGDYDLLLSIALLSTVDTKMVSNITPKGYGGCLFNVNSANNRIYRDFEYVSDTVLTFGAGKNVAADNNILMIPYIIYGIKFYSYDNISCVMMSSTWEAGQTTVEFTDPIIDGDSIFDVYLPSQYADLIYSSLSVSGHTLTITFPSVQASDIEVKLRVNRG